MEKGAKREGKSVWDIAQMYTEIWQKDLNDLNILSPDIWCRATDHIKEQIDLVKRLEEKGYTYRLEDGIYFDSAKFPAYADFAGLDIEGMQAGARVDFIEGKKNITDFVLWKFSPKDKKRAMEWESPWGTGFPGWHIECSAMAMKYLGETFDIHCGGIDHLKVHHTNEIAQAQAATGKTFVNYWLHGDFLVIDKKKMAKSGENFISLTVFKERGFDALAYRFFNFSAHYRAQLMFNWEAVSGAVSGFENLKDRVRELKEQDDAADISGHPVKQRFLKEINDDLNTSRAMAVVWETIKDHKLDPGVKLGLLLDFDRVLGLNLRETLSAEQTLESDVEELIRLRDEARKSRNWAESDRIRDLLIEKGIQLLDTPQGTKWKIKKPSKP
jgi:cysteinyl-tRNA synthetase